MITLYTLGHSNQSIDAFLSLLLEHGITQIADVRRYPSSRRWPQFNGKPLAGSLKGQAIHYRHFEALGGKRPTSSEAGRHFGLESSWQRDYAAYINTPQYAQALQDLLAWSRNNPTAIMCAEALPDMCHRFLLSDAVLQKGFRVIHVLPKTTKEHTYPPSLRIEEGSLIYDQGVLPFTF